MNYYHPGRIIILEHKHGTYPVFARTRKEEGAAYLFLFHFLDKLGYYKQIESKHQQLYGDAKDGNACAAQQLMTMRGDYEYERIYTEYVTVP